MNHSPRRAVTSSSSLNRRSTPSRCSNKANMGRYAAFMPGEVKIGNVRLRLTNIVLHSSTLLVDFGNELPHKLHNSVPTCDQQCARTWFQSTFEYSPRKSHTSCHARTALHFSGTEMLMWGVSGSINPTSMLVTAFPAMPTRPRSGSSQFINTRNPRWPQTRDASQGACVFYYSHPPFHVGAANSQ